jgi:hypothetical protein
MSQKNMNTDDLSAKEINKDKKRKKVDKRARSLRLFSVGSVIVIVAILLVLNLLFGSMFGSKLSWDLSEEKVNSIGDVSKGIVSKLSKDVEIVGLFEKNSSNETQYSDFLNILADYQTESNGKITVRYVDPVKYPSILTELDPNKTLNPSSGSFVVKCGDKTREINPADWIQDDEQAYYTTGSVVKLSNSVENIFTGAISAVTSDATQKVYFTSDHQEAAHEYLTRLLSNNSYDVADLSLLSVTSIPEDCSLLIIDNPLVDISKDEVTLLDDYLGRGGNLIVISDFEDSSINLDNLNEVLHTMNLNISSDRIVENNMDYRTQATYGFMNCYADIPTGTLVASAETRTLLTGYCRSITVFDNPKTYIKTEPLIQTSSNAVLALNGDENSIGAPGTQNIAMYSKNDGGKITSEAVVIGTIYLTSDDFIAAYTMNNRNVTFFNSIVNKLIGTTNTVQVPVMEYPSYTLTRAPAASMQGVWSVILVALIPLVFITIAIVVYRKRKHL